MLLLDVRFPTSLTGDGTDAMYVLQLAHALYSDSPQERRLRLFECICHPPH